MLQEAFSSRSDDIALVRQDDLTGGKLLGRHLIRNNVRSVLFLRPVLEWYAVEQREKGLRASFAESGKNVDIKTFARPRRIRGRPARIVRDYLESCVPDAIAAVTDSMAVAAVKACEAHGLQTPRDILITGFNGFDAWRYTRPSITTVVSPAYEMGRYAGELLLERLGHAAFAKRNVVFPVTLQPGGSA